MVGNLALAFFVVSCIVLIVCLVCVIAIGGLGTRFPEKTRNLRTSIPISLSLSNFKGHDQGETAETHIFDRFTSEAPECTVINADDVSFTLVTQLSADRLWMMKHHCERWPSIVQISVAVLTNQTTAQTREAIIHLGCHADFITVTTMQITAQLESNYPVNTLRTMALSNVHTSHVMYIDIDFWEAKDLHQIMNQQSVREVLAGDHKLALVVPAFQLNRQCHDYRDCPEDNIPMMPNTRKQMIDTIVHKRGASFDPTNRGGHGSTLYTQWIQQEPGDILPIPCIRSNRYEPYMVFRYCRELPPFQTQFSGYGKNKMTWVMQLRREGYLFHQLGGAFVIHYPHLDSISRMEWNQAPPELLPFKGDDGKMYKERPAEVKHANWDSFKRGKVDAIFIAFKKWMQSEINDMARVPMCDDRNDDDAKLWIERSER